MTDANKNLTIREAASRLRISEDTVKRMIRVSPDKIIRAGSQPRIPEGNLNQLAETYARQLRPRNRRQ